MSDVLCVLLAQVVNLREAREYSTNKRCIYVFKVQCCADVRCSWVIESITLIFSGAECLAAPLKIS